MQDQWKTNAHNRQSIVSFSGGKDSSLALYHAMQTGNVIGLIVMLEEQGQRSRSHAMPLDIIRRKLKQLAYLYLWHHLAGMTMKINSSTY